MLERVRECFSDRVVDTIDADRAEQPATKAPLRIGYERVEWILDQHAVNILTRMKPWSE